LVALDKNGNVISSAKPIHVATTGGTAGNVKSISVNKTKVTLGVNKKFTIKATVNSGKLKAAQHRKLSFESTNKSVAVVSKKGVITAKAKGTCYVYAYAQNGVYQKIKVTVR
jgi:preprotein translocase subunit YajC